MNEEERDQILSSIEGATGDLERRMSETEEALVKGGQGRVAKDVRESAMATGICTLGAVFLVSCAFLARDAIQIWSRPVPPTRQESQEIIIKSVPAIIQPVKVETAVPSPVTVEVPKQDPPKIYLPKEIAISNWPTLPNPPAESPKPEPKPESGVPDKGGNF